MIQAGWGDMLQLQLSCDCEFAGKNVAFYSYLQPGSGGPCRGDKRIVVVWGRVIRRSFFFFFFALGERCIWVGCCI